MKGVDNKEKPRHKVKKEVRSGRKLRLCVTVFKNFQFTFMMSAISLNDHIDTMAVMKPMMIILNDSQDGHHLGTYYTFTE